MLLPPYSIAIRGVILAIAGYGTSTDESVRSVCAKTPPDRIAPLNSHTPGDPQSKRIGFCCNLRLIEVAGQPVRAIIDVYLSRKGRSMFGSLNDSDAVIAKRVMQAYPLGQYAEGEVIDDDAGRN